MNTATIQKEGLNMGYETKVILVALAELTKKSKSVEEVYEHIVKMANAEGVVIEKLDKAFDSSSDD